MPIPRKIAVLGGGCGSLSAVYALTSRQGWQDHFDITVYQMGWRLGGKGASGRDRQRSDRIYEHGFHMWMGFYANAFSVMRECYEERARLLEDPGIFRSWTDAFLPHNRFVFSEQVGDDWRPWVIDYPTFPGDPSRPDEPLHAWDYLRLAVERLAAHLSASRHASAAPSSGPTTRHPWLERLAAHIGHDLEVLAVGGGVLALQAAIQMLELCRAGASAEGLPLLAAALEHARSRIEAQLAPLISTDDEARRLWIVLDLGCTVLKGIVADDVFHQGFDGLDDLEFRTWLRQHGASDLAIGSTPVSALYAANFSFVGGDRARPNFAAGVALQSYLRIFLASRGPFGWVMQSGMGDVVFSPLYQVLKARGVKFEFFHRVTSLRFDAAANTIATIEMQRQVRVPQAYEPIYRVNGVDAWPAEPFYDQIVGGDTLAKAVASGEIDLESSWSKPWRDAQAVELKHGQDYDLVVLGISLGALGTLCRDIADAKPAWQAMLDHVVTVPTQAQQLWLTRDLAALGWTAGTACVEGYPAPLGQWLDATHTLPRERWPASGRPSSLIYFCDVFEDVPNAAGDSAFPARRLAVAWAGTERWLEQHAAAVWPAAAGPGGTGLDWRLLVDPSDLAGAARLRTQYCRVNVEPSERFVLSVAGSTRHRLTAGGSGVDNLYLTGDWVRNGFNVGCVESTVMSGLQCSRAIAGYPDTIAHEHFFRARA